ncbi:MAG: DedA family protein [Gammaproteobacteria bacterium]|nr:DedA family protein [Gammaproteobacteria bacterium]
MELWGLFTSAFISSTLAPGSSEVVLAYLVLNSDIPNSVLGTVATAGNTLGALTTMFCGYLPARLLSGRFAEKFRHPKAFELLRKWGVYALLLSWLPVIGDALCFAAGWLRLSILRATMFIMAGKAARYTILIYLLA